MDIRVSMNSAFFEKIWLFLSTLAMATSGWRKSFQQKLDQHLVKKLSPQFLTSITSAKVLKKSQIFSKTLMSKEKLNFLLQIQILHFNYVWNSPSLSLAWFFLIQNELPTMRFSLWQLKAVLLLYQACTNGYLIGDGFCNDETNNPDCNFDGGDCCGLCIVKNRCSQCTCLQSEVTVANILVGDGYCNDETNNPNCSFDGGDCCGPCINNEFCSECQCHLGNLSECNNYLGIKVLPLSDQSIRV